MAILLARKAIHDFVERTIAAARDYQLAAFPSGTQRNLRSIAGAGGFGEFGFDAAFRQDFARHVQFFAATFSAASGIGIVNQKSVLKLRSSFH
jgi:hypothetical protein